MMIVHHGRWTTHEPRRLECFCRIWCHHQDTVPHFKRNPDHVHGKSDDAHILSTSWQGVTCKKCLEGKPWEGPKI